MIRQMQPTAGWAAGRSPSAAAEPLRPTFIEILVFPCARVCYDIPMENILFPKIKSLSGAVSYGGNQAWYESKAAAAGGCGAVSAANVLASLAASDPEVSRKLHISPGEGGVYSEQAYRSFMESIYRVVGSGFFFIKPFGVGIARYTQKVLSYALHRGLCLRDHICVTTFASYNRPVRFIYQGLKDNGAVALLASWNSYMVTFAYPKGVANAKIKNHFITITGIKKERNGDYTLTISTWGKKGTISYREIYQSWQGFRAFGTALVYFTPGGSEASVRRDICTAPLRIWSSMLTKFLGGLDK